MFLIYLVFMAALMLEIIGTYVSIIGLSSNASPILIILAIVFDFAKIVAVTVLYKKWDSLSIIMKAYLVPAVIVLMIITCYGAYGFLIQEFKKTINEHEQTELKISYMEKEINILELRKKDIDQQILQLPKNYVAARQQLMLTFKTELEQINARINELRVNIPKIKLDNLSKSNSIGTVFNISNAYNIKSDVVIRTISLIIIFVFDPLAIVLFIVGNFLQNQRKKEENKIEIIKHSENNGVNIDNLIKQENFF